MNSKSLILLVVYFVSFITVFGFKSTSFCNLIEKECVGSYDSELNYKVICKHVKCPTPYTYPCDVDRCAKNEQECRDFMNVDRYFSSIVLRNTIQNTYFAVHLQQQNKLKFQSFKIKIRNCIKSQYKWQISDVCVSGKTCFLNEKLTNFFTFF